MYEWWLVRNVEELGRLSTQEWQQLATAGERQEIRSTYPAVWGPHAGVLLVSRGTVRLILNGPTGQQTMRLEAGDMAGTKVGTPCLIEAADGATLHVFDEASWLDTLAQMPNLTSRLLFNMACRAMQAEQSVQALH